MNERDRELSLKKAAEEIAELEKSCFPEEFWSLENIFSTLKRNDVFFEIIYGEDRIPIGYYIAALSFDEAELYRIGVRPEHRGRGHGKDLMKKLAAACPKKAGKVFLEVRAGNEAAIGLYEKFGFKVIGRRKNYYANEDGLICLLEL